MRKLLAGTTVLAALSFLLPAIAQAKMTKLTLRTAAGVLAPGATLEAVGNGGDGWTFEGETPKISCATESLTLSLAGNEAAKDPATVTAGSFEGCKSDAFGPVALVSAHHPWPLNLSSRGIAEIQKGSAGKPTIAVTLGEMFGDAKCVYESSKLVPGFEPGPAGEPAPLTLTFHEEAKANVFKTNKHESNPACPRRANVKGAFEVLSGGEPVLAEL
jgi:hypothetical protein